MRATGVPVLATVIPWCLGVTGLSLTWPQSRGPSQIEAVGMHAQAHMALGVESGRVLVKENAGSRVLSVNLKRKHKICALKTLHPRLES